MVLRRLVSHVIDEAVATVILHAFLRHRGRPPASGKTPDRFPGLLSGDLASFFAPVPQPLNLAAAVTASVKRPIATVESFQFPSPVRGSFAHNNTVHGTRWRSHHGDGQLTVVALDGLVQVGYRLAWSLAHHLAPQGFDVVMMSTPYNHLRTPAGYRPGQLIISGDMEHQLSVARQAVLDLWTIIRSLQAEGRRVGLVGISYGGWLCLMASLIMDDLEFVTSLVPPVAPMHILGEGGTVVRAMRRGLGRGPLDVELLNHVSRSVTPHHWRPRLDPRRITLHAARYDRFVPPQRIVALAQQWGARLVMHDRGHVELSAGRKFIKQVADDIGSLAASADAKCA